MLPVAGGMTIIASLAGLAAVLAWRLRETRNPVSVRKIVIPPLGMAGGFSMFLLPAFRLPWLWAIGAFLLGAGALAYPLLLTSHLVWADGMIMARRSNAFIGVTLMLAVIRFLAREYLATVVSVPQTAALFYVLAFGMILRWRAAMLLEYRQLRRRGLGGR